jgi:hypothetical protein
MVKAFASAGKKLGIPLHFRTDVSDNLDQGLHAVSDLLAFDSNRPVSFDNQPGLRVNSKCRGTLWALHNYVYDNWTDETKAPKEKTKEIGKDWADCLRYFAMRQVKFRPWKMRGTTIATQMASKAERLASG